MNDEEIFSSSGQPGKLSAFGLSNVYLLRFLTIYLVYSAAITFVVVYLTGAPASLFDLEFGFGPKIALVADGKPLGDASRLPFLPYFLGWIARFWDNYSAALLLKNVLFHALTAWTFLRLWLAARGDWLTVALLVYLLTFPQWVRH